MSDLRQQKNGATVTAEDKDVYLDRGFENKARVEIAARALQKSRRLPPIRKKKVLSIRQQLAEGTYDIDERLNDVIDCLLRDLVA